ncbi:GNAT family N-acetyltransferase [Alkalibacterium sp.]
MTNESITYRPIRRSDYSALAALIDTSWNYSELTSSFNAKQMSYAFLFSSLAHQSFTQVAVKNNKPVGVAMGRTEEVPISHKLFLLPLFFNLIALQFTADGRKAFQSFRRNFHVNKSLLKQTYETYDGELVLFAVAPETQSMGVGSQLFEDFLKYLRSQGARTFYLFSDTSCTYSFYEHKGLKRTGVITRKMPFLKKEISFFLYRGSVADLLD